MVEYDDVKMLKLVSGIVKKALTDNSEMFLRNLQSEISDNGETSLSGQGKLTKKEIDHITWILSQMNPIGREGKSAERTLLSLDVTKKQT